MNVLDSAPADLFITAELRRRPIREPDYLREKQAIQELARRLADGPDQVLPKFVDLAMELTGGISAGLSLFEPSPAPGIFRWRYVRGSLAAFENSITPREFSPCGVTLDRSRPVLSLHPERFYTWIADANIVVPEVLLVPLYTGDEQPMGTLWIVSQSEGQFNEDHARIATELASFVSIAVKLAATEQRLQIALAEQEMLTKEMSHRIKNLFAISDVMVRMTLKAASSKEEMAQLLSGRFHALASAHGLIRRSFNPDGTPPKVLNLVELLRAVLKPHDHVTADATSRFVISGPLLACGEHALNGIALVFHELATNALKHGALATDQGRIYIHWIEDGDAVTFTWLEHIGSIARESVSTLGFGSKLLRDTVEVQFRGELEQTWGTDDLTVVLKIPLTSLVH